MRITTPRSLGSATASVVAGFALAVTLVLAAGLGLASSGGDDGEQRSDDTAPTTAAAGSRYPRSMDALGGSVSRGFNTDCPEGWVDCPENSWSTGSNPDVTSIYLRLLALNPQLRDHAYNDAESGTTMAALDGQADSAVQRGAELVTIAMGTNDACGGRTGVMTDVSLFRDEFAQAMTTLTSGLPQARVHVVSIPDLYRRWQTFRNDPSAMNAWRALPFCPTMFARPTSEAPADNARRVAVRARIREYNDVLAEVCATHPLCTTDHGALFLAPVLPADFSTHDYWHPNVAGQAALASLVWDTLEY